MGSLTVSTERIESVLGWILGRRHGRLGTLRQTVQKWLAADVCDGGWYPDKLVEDGSAGR